MSPVSRPAWFACFVLAGAACAVDPEDQAAGGRAARVDGQAVVDVHLEVFGVTGEWLELDRVALYGGSDEAPLEVSDSPFGLVPHSRLAGGEVAAGRYAGLELRIADAWKGDPAAGGGSLLVKDRLVRLPLPVFLEKGDTLDLQVSLDLSAPGQGEIDFAPAWSVGLSGPLLPSGAVLVADDRSGGVTVIDRKRHRVHRTILSGRPIAGMVRGLGLNDIFVVDSGRPEILSIDLVSGQVRDRRRLPTGSNPVWAALLPDRTGIAIANAARREVAVVEISTFLSGGGSSTSSSPGRMASSSEAGRIFVLLADSDRLAVLSLDGTEVVAERLVQSGPVDLALDRQHRRLAVACRRAGRLVILDTSSLSELASYFLGQGIQTVLFDDRDERLFVGFDKPPRLQSVDPSTGQALSQLTLPAPATDLELDPDGRLVWVACPGAGKVFAVDRFQLRIRAEIDVTGEPDRLLVPGLRAL